MKARDFTPGIEAGWAWGCVTLTLAVLDRFRGTESVGRLLPVLAAFLFLYVPPLMVRLRGGERGFLDAVVGWRIWGKGLVWALGTALVVFPVHGVLHHFWMQQAAHRPFLAFSFRTPPGGWIHFGLTQLIGVALAEEFFYRGYLMARLDREFPSRRRLLGVEVGPGWGLQALLFGAGHFLVGLHPLRAAVFFPALLFGWLRIRSGGLAAPIWLHAFANLWAWVLAGWYR